MVTDVSYLCRIMNQQQGQGSIINDSNSTVLITRDLLGAGTGTGDLHSSQELDLDVHVPSGYEKRLDLESGKVYLERCKSANTSSSSSSEKQHQAISKLQDLNFPLESKKALNLLDDTNLDLKLVPSSLSYQSVCTLDKVKSALEKAEKDTIKKRSITTSKSCSSPTSNSSSSVKKTGGDEEEEEEEDERSPQAYAAGCPSCLLYVLISRNNPKCPRCNMRVPSPLAMKKPRLDLNIPI